MIKAIVIGVWALLVALGSSYAVAMWSSGSPPATTAAAPEKTAGEVGLNGLEYRKPAPITIPMIADGRLRGYVVVKVVFTADAKALHAFPVDPQPFVLDETFRRIYTDGRVEFDQMSKYNLDDITASIKDNVNKRLGADLIHDVLIDELNYVDKESLDRHAQTASTER
jgi:hypothetical protein